MSARHPSVPSAGNNSINIVFNDDSESNVNTNLNSILNSNDQSSVKKLVSKVSKKKSILFVKNIKASFIFFKGKYGFDGK